MVELAIFGSLLILVLGLLINYGLGADFNQQGSMAAFRSALGYAQTSGRGSATVVMVKDRHVANPAHPFAFGQIVPIASSASVVKDPTMQITPQTPDDLPTMLLAVVGTDPSTGQPKQPLEFTTADIRTESGVAQSSLDRYHFIYGNTNVCSDPNLNPPCGASNLYCIESETDPETGRQVCLNWAMTILIVDSCEGQIINFDACVRQGRMIADDAYCTQQCLKTQSVNSTLNCATTCALPLAQPLPWYAQGCSANGCPALNTLFAATPRLGLQPGYTKTLTTNYSLATGQTAGGTTTVTGGSATEQTARTVVTSQGTTQPVTTPVPTQKDVDSNANWATTW